jgi:hypothetical protein
MRYFWLLLLAYLIFGLVHQNRGKTFGYKLDLFIDLFLGAAIWCEPGVTISSEVGKAVRLAKPPWWAIGLNRFLSLFQVDHCAKAILDDIARAEATIAYLKASP